MAAQEALPFDFVAAWSVCLFYRIVVCCLRYCKLCKALVTRSSGAGSDAAGSVAVDSSHPCLSARPASRQSNKSTL